MGIVQKWETHPVALTATKVRDSPKFFRIWAMILAWLLCKAQHTLASLISPLCMIMKSGPTHITMSHYFCTLKWPPGTHPTWLLYWEFCPTKGQNLLLILSYQPIIHTYIYINESYSSMAMVNLITQSTHTRSHASNARCLNHKNDTNKQKK